MNYLNNDYYSCSENFEIHVSQGRIMLFFHPPLAAGGADLGVCVATEGSINVPCSVSCELQCSEQAITHTIKHNEDLDRLSHRQQPKIMSNPAMMRYITPCLSVVKQ